jgi:integrase
MSTVAVAELRAYLDVRETPPGRGAALLFPWWDGQLTEHSLRETTDFLSKLFHNTRSPGIFDTAGCVGLKFHDLRHEATSRLFERTTLSEMEIAKITGHRSMKMLARYANLRGSVLASKLW